ncbi:type II secretion system GspH family protein [Clostridium sp. CS001]|uniref:type IV pilus modification PilV family protein n=1 Tax=Clostridium sp. CS001 TaxID=2880648 RepID=UPI001CF420D9|nr:type II secretion system protein [Clostridium sp. CS001]MCB2288474.1 type II secretion system GspH family protein [Clostridium sp. CS001]
MLRLISKKGFTLVEVLCSLGVFSIIFICMISYEVSSINIKRNIKTINDNVLIMETFKNNIIYSMTFEELELLQRDNRTFINKENMTFDKSNAALADVFSKQVDIEEPYMKLSFVKYELKVYSLNLSLYSGKPNNSLELQCNFYKGCHK